MSADQLTHDLYNALQAIPVMDPHSHINPFAPTAKTLDDILGYHYYTELAHSAGMSKAPLDSKVPAQERVQAILQHLSSLDNTTQYAWFVAIAQHFLGFDGDRVTAADATPLWNKAETTFTQSDWEAQVFQKSNLECIFLTNEFDDRLDGFDAKRYVPCLRTDTLVFQFQDVAVRERLARLTNVEIGDAASLRHAFGKLFEHFKSHGARACAISLPPTFQPTAVSDLQRDALFKTFDHDEPAIRDFRHSAVFWLLAEMCQEYRLPFDLMIGVNRQVYPGGVYQGQDLFDQRTSLLQYAELFNAFPEVTFPVSVLTSSQNQELVSYAWIFPNVVTSGHWWYSNIPAYITNDLRARLQAVPKTKQIGYYSDAYKLEFVLPKFTMYRRILATVLADDFVRPGQLSETQAVELGRQVLRDNVRGIFFRNS